MKVKREDLVSVMDWAGYKLARKWNDDRLKKKAKGLHREVSDKDAVGDNYLDNVLDELLYAGKNGDEIELISEDAVEEETEEVGPAIEVPDYVEPLPKPPPKHGDMPTKPVQRRKLGSLSRAGAAARVFFDSGLTDKYDADMITRADKIYSQATGKKSNLGTQRVIMGVVFGGLREYLQLMEDAEK